MNKLHLYYPNEDSCFCTEFSTFISKENKCISNKITMHSLKHRNKNIIKKEF